MFGLLSAALGFAAEATKLQIDEVKDVYRTGCTYPSNSGRTVTLVVLALVALLGIRVYCPGTRSPSSVVQLSRYLSWVAWFMAMIFYAVGLIMMKNQEDTFEYRDDFQSYYKCNVVKPGIFGAGASFALTSVVLEIVYSVVTQNETAALGFAVEATKLQLDEVKDISGRGCTLAIQAQQPSEL
ncbi:hypothetical protein L1987_70663 [Smallanthus sonchifolius]|uniref:Uncharacterized protein n=1 Tax=Smallanthus sonchifolius TaxID=185202 RepID=A0ACB9APY4_9ASTR|nr:hypothetical protein L1987_70663 [Smallanthus sonchifolius]